MSEVRSSELETRLSSSDNRIKAEVDTTTSGQKGDQSFPCPQGGVCSGYRYPF